MGSYVDILVDTKLRLHDITWKAALGYGSEIWILNNKNAHKFEVALMCFLLRSLLSITRLDHLNNTVVRLNV